MTAPPENPPPENPTPPSNSPRLPQDREIIPYRTVREPLTSRQIFFLALTGFLGFYVSIGTGWVFSFFIRSLLAPISLSVPCVFTFPVPTLVTLYALIYFRKRGYSAPLTGFLIALGLSPLIGCGVFFYAFGNRPFH